MNYFVWSPSNAVQNAVALDALTGFDRVGRLWRGERLAGEFPEDVTFQMRSEFPENTVLTDSLSNLNSLIVGSRRLVDFLKTRNVAEIEYHAVQIRDHKRKLIKDQYYIVNPVSNLDCLDFKASGATMSRIKATKVQFIKKLVLRDEAVDASRQIFRIANFDSITLVREDLTAALNEAGFTGFRWIESAKYPR